MHPPTRVPVKGKQEFNSTLGSLICAKYKAYLSNFSHPEVEIPYVPTKMMKVYITDHKIVLRFSKTLTLQKQTFSFSTAIS